MNGWLRPKVYVAGPLGFTTSGRQYHEMVVVPALIAAGFDLLDPWALDDDMMAVFFLPPGDEVRVARLPEVNAAIGRRNAEMIREATCVLAFLDGSDVDSGTAAEIGYAAALARPVVGLRTDTRISGDNEVSIVNLQVEWFIAESHGTICRDLDAAIHELRTAANRGN